MLCERDLSLAVVYSPCFLWLLPLDLWPLQVDNNVNNSEQNGCTERLAQASAVSDMVIVQQLCES